MSLQKPAVRHHYVPILLLKRFCEGKKSRLWVFDKWTRKSFKTHVKRIALESHFNDFEIEGQKVTVEPSLTNLENRVAPICKHIIRDGALSRIKPEERALLSDFIAVQIIRTRQGRNMILDFHNLLKTEFENRGADIRDLNGYVEMTDNELKKQGVLALENTRLFSKTIEDKAWLLMEAPKGNPFYISDHPVARQNLIKRPFRGNLGLASEGIELYLPLSSRYCLFMACPSYREKFLGAYQEHVNPHSSTELQNERKDGLPKLFKETVEGFITGSAVKADGPVVENLNSLQVKSSARFVFSNRNDFSLVTSMLDENPDLEKGIRLESC